MLASRDAVVGADDRLLDAEEVVAEARAAVLEVERPAAAVAAQVEEDAVAPPSGTWIWAVSAQERLRQLSTCCSTRLAMPGSNSCLSPWIRVGLPLISSRTRSKERSSSGSWP